MGGSKSFAEEAPKDFPQNLTLCKNGSEQKDQQVAKPRPLRAVKLTEIRKQKSIKELLGSLVEKRRKNTLAGGEQIPIFPKKSKSEIPCIMAEKEEDDEYSLNPFGRRLTPVKLRDRSATVKEEELIIVTMNDIGMSD